MLQQSRLLGNLRRFHDVEYGSFEGFPATRDAAREAWAKAFADYISVIEEGFTRPPPPPDAHPTLDLAGVQGAFFADLGLVNATAEDAAIDFAGAWQQAVAAIKPIPLGAPDATTSVYVFTAFGNAASLQGTLKDQLKALFLAPSAMSQARLGEIATAFHTATTGLIGTFSVTTGPNTTTKTVGVR